MAVWSYIEKSQLEGALRLDAEYYQPKYLDITVKLSNLKHSQQINNFAKVLRGKNPTKYTETGIPIIRAVNLRDLTNLDDILYADEKEKLFYLKLGDVLISSIGEGSIGKVEVFTKGNRFATASEVSVIRSTNYNPFFLAVFLKTKYGYFQLERRITGSTGQLHLYPRDIATVVVPNLSDYLQKGIENLLRGSIRFSEESKNLYLRAEQMLLDVIGFDKINFNVKKCFVVNLSETTSNKRIDGEHFHTRFKNLKEHLLKTNKTKSLKELRTFIKRGLQPEYVENGEIIVINSQHLGRTLLNIEDTEKTDRKFFEKNKRAQVKRNDILFYSTGAYIGRTNVYIEDKEAIASNHVAIIRTTKKCNPIYLSVYLNSPLGLMQTDQWASGSAQREIYPDDIDKFLVYLPSSQFQQKIADLVQKSHEARKKAKELLGEAKRKVEEMIQDELVS